MSESELEARIRRVEETIRAIATNPLTGSRVLRQIVVEKMEPKKK
jgi:hypothetical protein